jgi:hypothetical protein
MWFGGPLHSGGLSAASICPLCGFRSGRGAGQFPGEWATVPALSGRVPVSCGIAHPVWGTWATAPVYRGPGATSPERLRPPYGARGPRPPSIGARGPQAPNVMPPGSVRAALCHSGQVASITRRHAELARWLGDPLKMALTGTTAHPPSQEGMLRRTSGVIPG